jgi:antitoxin (DNA-binding transcriptional repressor) of toxin-antitoxin stability system
MSAILRVFNIHDARTSLSRLIEETVNSGEPFVIAKAGKPLVKVVRIDVETEKSPGRIGFMKRPIKVPANTDKAIRLRSRPVRLARCRVTLKPPPGGGILIYRRCTFTICERRARFTVSVATGERKVRSPLTQCKQLLETTSRIQIRLPLWRGLLHAVPVFQNA